MNKELVKKYKNEFDHWLNGGELLFYFRFDDTWLRVSDVYKWSTKLDDLLLIINDKYVEERKAQALGKQLQVSYDGGISWFDKSTRKIQWNNRQLVRVKPEKSKFKVGDWVSVAPKNKKIHNVFSVIKYTEDLEDLNECNYHIEHFHGQMPSFIH